jgi:hypothetical protein
VRVCVCVLHEVLNARVIYVCPQNQHASQKGNLVMQAPIEKRLDDSHAHAAYYTRPMHMSMHDQA